MNHEASDSNADDMSDSFQEYRSLKLLVCANYDRRPLLTHQKAFLYSILLYSSANRVLWHQEWLAYEEDQRIEGKFNNNEDIEED